MSRTPSIISTTPSTRRGSSVHRIWRGTPSILIAILSLSLHACVTLTGETVYTDPEGVAVSLREVLEELDEQQNALKTLQATRVSFMLDTARSDATFAGRGDVIYRQPDGLHVIARHRTSGTVVLRMTVDGGSAAMSYGVGADRGDAAWRNGVLVSGEPTPFTPWEVVREVFQPEPWSQLPRASVRISEPYSELSGHLVLAIGQEGAERRLVRISGPPWRVVENHLLGAEGPLARTHILEHREFDGMLIPTDVQADFFQDPASLRIQMTRDPHLNEPVDDRIFRVEQ